MIKRLMREITPPVLYRSMSKVLAPSSDGNRLFNGDDEMFRACIEKATVYGEYGCGASTIWVNKNHMCPIYSVDTSRDWVDRVTALCDAPQRLQIRHVDLGPVAAWGRPTSYDKDEYFEVYREWIWKQQEKPDLILIDGRFRVSCFLASILCAQQPIKIIFDDYRDRQGYHVIERVLEPIEFCGRQALFELPSQKPIDTDLAENLLKRFAYVMD